MKRAINFNAGPAAIPQEVLEQAQAEMLDWKGTGMSVMEVSHLTTPCARAAPAVKRIGERNTSKTESLTITERRPATSCRGGNLNIAARKAVI